MTTPELTLEMASPEVKHYQRLKIASMLIGSFLGLGWLAVVAVLLGPTIGQLLTFYLGEGRWLRLVGMAAFLEITFNFINIPLDFWSSYIVEHRFQLSNQSLDEWILERAKGYLVSGIIGLIMLSVLYLLMWTSGSLWWIWATAGWLLVSIFLVQLYPVVILPLFYKVTRLDDEPLLARLRDLTKGTTLTIKGVYRLGMSKDTKKANAFLAGLGNTRRVLLGDTLLEQFTPEEIEVIFAHEVGHHVHGHALQEIAHGTMIYLCGLLLVNMILPYLAPALGYTKFTDPAALPLVLLVLTLFGWILSGYQGSISRLFERQCDRYALEKTGNPAAFRSALIKLARINKSNPDPHPLIAKLFSPTHPTIRERLALNSRQSNGPKASGH